jgi:hypothetical protein
MHHSCTVSLNSVADAFLPSMLSANFSALLLPYSNNLFIDIQPKWHRFVRQPHLAITSQPHALDVVTLTSTPHLLPLALALFSTFDLLHMCSIEKRRFYHSQT